VKGTVFWVVTACSLFAACPGILLGLFLDPDDGGHVPQKRHPLSELHGFSNKKTALSIVIAVRSELHSNVYILYSIS
jgi:hypothetical protein